jgi:hypothetical protein
MSMRITAAPIAERLVQPAGSLHPHTEGSQANFRRISCTSNKDLLVRLIRRKSFRCQPQTGQDFLRGVLVSPLRRRMIEDMTIRNLPPATQRSYLHVVEKFSRNFDRPPAQLGLEDAWAYQGHLASKGVASATLNRIVCAPRFLYGVTLRQDEMPGRISYAKRPRTLPEVLSREEVVRFLEAVPSAEGARCADNGLCNGDARVRSGRG